MKKTAILLVALLASGCTYHIARLDEKAAATLVGFIDNGRTTRAEIVARLGEPHRVFERDNIITYVANEEGGQLALIRFSQIGTHHLVIALDANGVVERHSIIHQRQ